MSETPSAPDQLTLVAYHEAGHFVVNWAGGGERGVPSHIHEISIVPGEHHLGVVSGEYPLDDLSAVPETKDVEEAVCGLLGGLATQKEVDPHGYRGAKLGASDDLELVADFLSRHGSRQMVFRCWRRTVELVNEYWSTIQDLAEYLLEVKRASAGEAEALCDAANRVAGGLTTLVNHWKFERQGQSFAASAVVLQLLKDAGQVDEDSASATIHVGPHGALSFSD